MHCEEWSWETGGTRSRESTPGQGKSKPEGVFQLPAWRGLIPFSATPRAVGRNTPQDCLPEKWKGECFSTSSVPGWSRVPKRLKSVPLTSASGQGSPQREALQADLLFQHHSSKASILRCSAFFTVQLSHPYMTTGMTREQ